MKTSKYGIFDQIEKLCQEKEKFITEQIRSIKDMWVNYNYLIEYREVLEKVSSFLLSRPSNIRINRLSGPFMDSVEEVKGIGRTFDEHLFERASESSEEDHEIGGDYQQVKILNLSSIAGIIQREEVSRMKKIVFRASRGNALIHTIPIEKTLKEYSGSENLKDVYIITFQEGEALRDKLSRI